MVQQLKEECGLEVGGDRVEHVSDRSCRRGRIELHRDRSAEDILGQPPDIIRHGCPKHQRLAHGRHVFNDLPDIGKKPHIQHSVRLIKHKDLHVWKPDCAPLDVVEQPTWTSDDDFDSGSEPLDLWANRDPPIDRKAVQARLAAQRFEGSVNLIA